LGKTYVYPIQRTNDEHIMLKVIASGRFKDKDIQRINYCQIYLNVTTIANVTLACGKQLDPHMYKGKRSLFSSVATYMKIHQQKPGLASCGVWRKAMVLWATEYNLKVPLKEWYFPSSRLSQHWPSYYDYATDKLYIHHQDTFLQYTRNQEEGIFHYEQDSEWIPTESAVPLQVNTYDGAKSWTGHYCYGLHKSIPYPLDGTFQNFVLALDRWEASLLDTIKCPTDIFTAMKKMEQREFVVVTNGSAGEINMSFGWKICTLNGDFIAEHSGPAFGQASSFRAEGYGVLSALSFFRQQWNI
jgi:hypothetical protein